MANLFTSLEDSVRKNKHSSVYTWEARERYWTPKDRAWYVMYAAFFILLIAFAAILQEFILIIAIVAFVFLWFIQASIPPEIIQHSITDLGIKTYGKLFKWKQIRHFWFSEKNGVKYLHLELSEELLDVMPYKRLSLLCENDEDIDIFDLMITNVDYGDKQEIGYWILTHITNGAHISLQEYMPDTLETFETEEDTELYNPLPKTEEKQVEESKEQEEELEEVRPSQKRRRNAI